MFPSNRRKGFSLVEMLVALAIAGLVMTTIYEVFINQSRTQYIQDMVAEMQQNARAAMDLMARDVRLAGYDLIGAKGVIRERSSQYVYPITGVDGGTNGTDRLTIYYSSRVSESCALPTLRLAASFDPRTDSVIRLTSLPSEWTNPSPCNGVTIGGSPFNDFLVIIRSPDESSALIVKITGMDSVQKQLTADVDSSFVYPAGMQSQLNDFSAQSALDLFSENPNYQGFTYLIDTSDSEHPALLRDTDGNPQRNTDMVADDIEDLQVVYIDENGVETHGPPADPTTIRAVRISLIARTSRINPARSSVRPALENHAASSTADSYMRLTLTSTIHVRNM